MICVNPYGILSKRTKVTKGSDSSNGRNHGLHSNSHSFRITFTHSTRLGTPTLI